MTGHVIHVHTTTAASVDAVWSVLADPQRTIGQRNRARLFGHHGVEPTVVESEPPRRLVEQTHPGHDQVTIAWSVQPAAHDETKVLCTATLDVRERSVGEKLRWNMFGEHGYNATRKAIEADLAEICAEAERHTAAGRHRAS